MQHIVRAADHQLRMLRQHTGTIKRSWEDVAAEERAAEKKAAERKRLKGDRTIQKLIVKSVRKTRNLVVDQTEFAFYDDDADRVVSVAPFENIDELFKDEKMKKVEKLLQYFYSGRFEERVLVNGADSMTVFEEVMHNAIDKTNWFDEGTLDEIQKKYGGDVGACSEEDFYAGLV